MNRQIIFSAVLMLSASQSGAERANTSPAYQAFPPGYGYMNDTPALQKAINKGDRKTIREHAWGLWTGMMQPDASGQWPVWYTWPNTNAAFDAAKKPETALAAMDTSPAQTSLIAHSINNVPVNTRAPSYPLPKKVRDAFPGAICSDKICATNTRFMFNGDIMIPTESLSRGAFVDLRNPTRPLYKQSTLNAAHKAGEHMLSVTPEFIVTKHMYWPVKAKGLSPLPIWTNDFPYSFPGYAGYEVWDRIVAIDPTGTRAGQKGKVEFLHGIKNHDGTDMDTKHVDAPIYSIEDFYYHKVTKDEWRNQFSEADRAVINASSYWSYNEAFGPGDYLITVAAHINTREVPSWTLQSAWWSDTPNQGIYAANRPVLPQAKGPWQHYLITDDYALPDIADGTLNVAVNPYIEGVIHPIGTSCRNCHVRAGWPEGKAVGKASYQNPDCPGLLTYLTPQSECLKNITLTDYLWIIPDHAVKE